jgi:hypothetical protein
MGVVEPALLEEDDERTLVPRVGDGRRDPLPAEVIVLLRKTNVAHRRPRETGFDDLRRDGGLGGADRGRLPAHVPGSLGRFDSRVGLEVKRAIAEDDLIL